LAVPRKNPLPADEIEICRRLRAFRQSLGIPRTVFAVKTGLKESLLVRIEHFRAPLRYEVYKRVIRAIPFDPSWLRTGTGSPKRHAPIDDSAFAESLPESALFSEVYDQHLRSQLDDQTHAARADMRKALSAAKSIAPLLKEGKLSATQANKLAEQLQQLVSEAAHVLREQEAFSERLNQNGLTETSVFRKTQDVKREFTLPRLLSEVRRLTSAPGMKAKLAAHLKVPQARVSEWLKEKYIPSGDITLELLNWVRSQERK